MDSTRQQKISRLLQKELALIFQQQSADLFRNALVSVTAVRVAPDLSFAKVYVSIFSPQTEKNDIFERVSLNTKQLRWLLAQKIGKQVRIIPELLFVIDDTLDYIENIENILQKP